MRLTELDKMRPEHKKRRTLLRVLTDYFMVFTGPLRFRTCLQCGCTDMCLCPGLILPNGPFGFNYFDLDPFYIIAPLGLVGPLHFAFNP